MNKKNRKGKIFIWIRYTEKARKFICYSLVLVEKIKIKGGKAKKKVFLNSLVPAKRLSEEQAAKSFERTLEGAMRSHCCAQRRFSVELTPSHCQLHFFNASRSDRFQGSRE